MEQVDLLLTGGMVVTMNDQFEVFEDGAVAIRGERIAAVGTARELQAQTQAREIIDCGGQAIIPGLVNAHTHVPMTLLRGLADDLRLDVWLLGYMMPVERQFVNPDFVRLGTLLGCAEMIRSGVTCFADMYYFEEEIARSTAEAGLRALCAQTVLKFPSPDAGSYEDSLAACREFIQRWRGHDLIVPAIGPHAPYTCTAEILRACAETAVEFDVPLHIHVSETELEVENSRKEHGMPVVPWIKKQGVLQAKVLAAHCVHVDEGEMRTLLHAGAGVAHNPTSNLKLASGIAPVSQMLDVGLNVGIGTDGPASNNDLDMFEETRLAALLAKGAGGDPTLLPARTAFAMATILGARALHLGDSTGSLVPGKRADLVVVGLSPLHNTPAFRRDPQAIYSQLVYAAKSTDVRHVLCNGRWLMRDYELLTLDEDSLQEEARQLAHDIDRFLIAREGNILSKLLAIGPLEQEESFEVQVKARLDHAAAVEAGLHRPEITIAKSSRYSQYDTYFLFPERESAMLRIREDVYLDERDQPTPRSRRRLTLTGSPIEREFPHSILLSRSRFIAPAEHSKRFYQEYFQPQELREVIKHRRRYRILYKDTDFAINIDHLTRPSLPGVFIEIKSRTWSKSDAERKAELIGELLPLLGIDETTLIREEYLELALAGS